MKIALVDNTPTLQKCLAAICPHASDIAIDIEGVSLGRNGRIAIVQLFARGSKTVWLVDVTTLGARAFDEADEQGRCLRDVFKDSNRKKVRVHDEIPSTSKPCLVLLRCSERFRCVVQPLWNITSKCV